MTLIMIYGFGNHWHSPHHLCHSCEGSKSGSQHSRWRVNATRDRALAQQRGREDCDRESEGRREREREAKQVVWKHTENNVVRRGAAERPLVLSFCKGILGKPRSRTNTNPCSFFYFLADFSSSSSSSRFHSESRQDLGDQNHESHGVFWQDPGGGAVRGWKY